MSPQIAYLAGGKLHLLDGSNPVRNIESTYGEGIRQRLLKSQQRHSWKGEGSGGNFLSGQMLWGKSGQPAPIHVELTSLCSGNVPGHLLYTLQSETLCGLLSLEISVNTNVGSGTIMPSKCGISPCRLMATSLAAWKTKMARRTSASCSTKILACPK